MQSINLFKQYQVFRYTLHLHNVQKLASVSYISLSNQKTWFLHCRQINQKGFFVSTKIIKQQKFCVGSLTPFQNHKDFVIFVCSSDLCYSSYEQVLTQALWYLCQHFFLAYSLVYITEPVFLSFLHASTAQKWKKTKIYNQNTLCNDFAEL